MNLQKSMCYRVIFVYKLATSFQAGSILITEYPNVSKITRAGVDVQPYAFTTKSLFVGHTNYKY